MLLLTMMPMGLSALASTELAVTNKRVIGRVRKQRLSVPFTDIETVRARRSIPGLLFNYGSITIIGNGVRVKFPGITKPHDMKSIIDTAVEKALFGDIVEGDTAKPKTPLRNPTAQTAKAAAKLPPAPPRALPPKPVEENIFAPKNDENESKLPPIYKDPNTW